MASLLLVQNGMGHHAPDRKQGFFRPLDGLVPGVVRHEILLTADPDIAAQDKVTVENTDDQVAIGGNERTVNHQEVSLEYPRSGHAIADNPRIKGGFRILRYIVIEVNALFFIVRSRTLEAGVNTFAEKGNQLRARLPLVNQYVHALKDNTNFISIIPPPSEVCSRPPRPT